jgi:threo-3-hydroxy-L-aspartate ammonia-lyase
VTLNDPLLVNIPKIRVAYSLNREHLRIHNFKFMTGFDSIVSAAKRIAPHIHHTPILTSSILNLRLGHQVFFKAECLQKVGAFKARGACNAIAKLVEEGAKPKRIIANSSGNHAQAVAWASRKFGIPSTIYMPGNVSKVKLKATVAYGAEIVVGKTRAEIDRQVEAASREDGVAWIHPYNQFEVIAGQGTIAIEVFDELEDVDAIFAPCGGGGLLSGTSIATRQLSSKTKVIGVEPANADDARRSIEQGSIYRFDHSPDTLADGARTLAVGALTFEHLRQLDDFYTVEEEAIMYWTQWLTHLLKLRIEPTSAMSMDAAYRWLNKQSTPQRIVVILSGGNMDAATSRKIWEQDFLTIFSTERYAD